MEPKKRKAGTPENPRCCTIQGASQRRGTLRDIPEGREMPSRERIRAPRRAANTDVAMQRGTLPPVAGLRGLVPWVRRDTAGARQVGKAPTPSTAGNPAVGSPRAHPGRCLSSTNI